MKTIVFTAQSEFYHLPVTSISTFDDQASALKVYGLFGETVTEGVLVYDSEKEDLCGKFGLWGRVPGNHGWILFQHGNFREDAGV